MSVIKKAMIVAALAGAVGCTQQAAEPPKSAGDAQDFGAAGCVVKDGDYIVMGVNKFKPESEAAIDVLKVDNSTVRRLQIDKLGRLKKDRVQADGDTALAALTGASSSGGTITFSSSARIGAARVGVTGTSTATGTLTSSDVDAAATKTWSIVGTNSTTYGAFTLNATTGVWTYVLNDTLAATQALKTGDVANKEIGSAVNIVRQAADDTLNLPIQLSWGKWQTALAKDVSKKGQSLNEALVHGGIASTAPRIRPCR